MVQVNSIGNKIFFCLAGLGALLAMSANMLDVVLGMAEPEVAVSGSKSAREWFLYIREDRFRGLYLLGFLNLVYMICMFPVYLGLTALHYRRQTILPVTAMTLFLLALAIYVSNNAAIPMVALADKYAAAETDVQRMILAAAGESALARGEDFTPSAFPGMILSGIAAVTVSAVMLRGDYFTRFNAWIGVAGFLLLSLFTITATFFPSLYHVSYYSLGMTGGLLALAWFLLTGLKFLQLAQR